MTFAPICRLLLATALLSAVQAHAQLDDLFRNPGSPASAPVESKPKPPTATVPPRCAQRPRIARNSGPDTQHRRLHKPIGRRTCHRQQPGHHHRRPCGDLHHPHLPALPPSAQAHAGAQDSLPPKGCAAQRRKPRRVQTHWWARRTAHPDRRPGDGGLQPTGLRSAPQGLESRRQRQALSAGQADFRATRVENTLRVARGASNA